MNRYLYTYAPVGEHCCLELTQAISDPRVLVSYSPQFREYFVFFRDVGSVLEFTYCPWCAAKFAGSLREQWFEILEQEYKVESPFQDLENARLPKPFMTDEWWKERGL